MNSTPGRYACAKRRTRSSIVKSSVLVMHACMLRGKAAYKVFVTLSFVAFCTIS